MFFAQFFQINHGAWIALGVVTMMHPNIGTIKTLGKDSILGSLIGLLLGVSLVFIAWDSPLLYIIFVLNLFLVIYFKTYPFVLWSLVLMLEFVLMFALVDNNFIELIAYRFSDILLGFLFAFFISKILYPRYSADDLLPQIKLCLEHFATLTLDLEQSQSKVLEGQNKLVRSLDELSLLITQSQNDKKLYSPHTLKLFDELMRDFYQLKESLIMLCERVIDREKKLETLLNNDLKALRVRYEMLCAMIESQPYYFKTDEDERFLLKDESIYPIVREIFELQNRVYNFLHTTLGK